jgi:hypothetical protein
MCRRPRSAIRCARLLLKYGALLHEMTTTDVWWSGSGDTPLSYASRLGAAHLVRLFIELEKINPPPPLPSLSLPHLTPSPSLRLGTQPHQQHRAASMSSSPSITASLLFGDRRGLVPLLPLNPYFEAIRSKRYEVIQLLVHRSPPLPPFSPLSILFSFVVYFLKCQYVITLTVMMQL